MSKFKITLPTLAVIVAFLVQVVQVIGQKNKSKDLLKSVRRLITDNLTFMVTGFNYNEVKFIDVQQEKIHSNQKQVNDRQ